MTGGETIEDMDKEIENKDNKNNYLADGRRVSDEQFVQQMEQVNLIEILDNTDRVIKRLDETLVEKKGNH